jgi:hypothetical protein
MVGARSIPNDRPSAETGPRPSVEPLDVQLFSRQGGAAPEKETLLCRTAGINGDRSLGGTGGRQSRIQVREPRSPWEAMRDGEIEYGARSAPDREVPTTPRRRMLAQTTKTPHATDQR